MRSSSATESTFLVSVIVPVYNVEDYLTDCVNSLSSQSHKNIEIILVNDGSPDGSGDICYSLAEKDNRIRVITKQNEGLNLARKTGFEDSKGDYVVFIDSDDALRHDAIEIMLGAAIDASSDLIIGGYIRFSHMVPSLEGGETVSAEVLDKNEAIRGLLLGSGHENILMMTACGKLFNRSVIESIDWEASNYRANEDEFMALQYYSAVETKVLLIPDGFYMYRDNPNSITRSAYKNSYNGKPLGRFDTVDLIYQEAISRLDNAYAPLALVKFIYEFISSIHKQVVNNDSIQEPIDAYNKYFVPKKPLFTDDVLKMIDPQTRAQYEGLVDGGVVGCIWAKVKFIESENQELLAYLHNLEKAIVEKDETIEDQSSQIRILENHLGVRAGRLYRSILGKFKRSS